MTIEQGIMAFGTVVALTYIVILLSASIYDDHLMYLEKEKDTYRFFWLYGVGLQLARMTGRLLTDQGKGTEAGEEESEGQRPGRRTEKPEGSSGAGMSLRGRKRRQILELLYGPKSVVYYYNIITAQQYTAAATLIVLGFALYGCSGEIIIIPAAVFFAICIAYYLGDLPLRKLTERNEELLSQLPDAVSKLTLLTNAGMILKEAWDTVGKASDGILYREMRRATLRMTKEGLSEIEAYEEFGMRCGLPEIKKFAGTIAQGVQRGNRELAVMLKEQNREVWDIRRNQVKRKGEQASGKLLAPMFIMFFGILIIVVVPIFTNLGF